MSHTVKIRGIYAGELDLDNLCQNNFWHNSNESESSLNSAARSYYL